MKKTIFMMILATLLVSLGVSGTNFNLPVEWILAPNGTSIDLNGNGYPDWCDNSVSGGAGGTNDTDTLWDIDGTYLDNVTGTLTFDETLLNTTIDARAGGNDGNNYTSDLVVTNGTTATITLSRVGMDDIVAQFSNPDTDTDTTYSAGGTLLDLTGTTFSVNEGTLTNNKICQYVTGTGIQCTYDDIDTNTQIGNCSVDQSCDNVIYSSDTTLWDKDTSNDFNTTTALVGEVTGVYSSTVLDHDALDDQYIELGDAFGGDVTGTYNNIVVTPDSTTLSCSNITGATSNLCTIVDTDTDTTVGNCSGSESCSEVAYINVFNDGDLNVSSTYDICIQGGNCLSDAGVGSGDITSVNTNGRYLTGGSASGDVDLLFNESELNTTIDSRAGGNDGNNYTSDLVVTNGTTATITLSRVGMDDIVAQFENPDTDTDTTYTENSPYLTLAATVFGFDETLLNTTIDARSDFDTDTTIGNCTVDQSCDNVVYDADTTVWDKDTSNNVNTTTSFGGEVSGTYGNIVLSNSALDDAYIELGDSFGGEVSGTYGAITLDNDALDDQYYDSEGDLTTLLDNDYVDVDGDTMTGNLAMSDKNVTGLDCITFTSGGQICDLS